MTDPKSYAENLFKVRGININSTSLFEEFVKNEEVTTAVQNIVDNQNHIMEKWKIKTRVSDIISQQVILPNGTIGKSYSAKFDFEDLKLTDLIKKEFHGLRELGLTFNSETNEIQGIPIKSGDLKIKFLFKTEMENGDTPLNEKDINLIVNPDPKTLWKNIPSDRDDPFWKEDNITAFARLGKKHIVAASKRGRSHQNVGSFRDDDFSFKHIEETGWSVVSVSDGAGSYSLARLGSQIACHAIVDYFEENSNSDNFQELEQKLKEFNKTKDEALLEETRNFSKQILYKATLHVHNTIKDHAGETIIRSPELFNNPKAKTPLDYYHATLIFVLFKKFDFGYVIMSFGVGDCPIAIMNLEKTNTKMLNWLDVGEFGGGTRFITQPDIFHSTERPMSTRFNFTIEPDFSYLFLMSDGIYDPKFVVEANLEKHEKWIEFLDDLGGKNEEDLCVKLNSENKEIEQQLSRWMDFWNPGNHDDRTLAIIF